MVNAPRHKNWQLVQNFQYQIYMLYLFSRIVQKVNAHVDEKLLNMQNQSQKCFWGIFIGIPQYQKG